MRKSILLASAFCFVTLTLLATLVYRALPGPVSQEILGVGIGSNDYGSGIVIGIVDVGPSHIINPNQEVQGWKPFLQSDCWKSC